MSTDVFPDKQSFCESAKNGNLIPVYREFIADTLTPVAAFDKLGGGEYSFLLESILGGENWGAYSFVGIRPRAVVRHQDKRASVTWWNVDGGGEVREVDWEESDPVSALEEVMAEWKPVENCALPRFWGGAVGWLSYDCARAFETLPNSAAAGIDVPDLCMVISDSILIFDNRKQTVKVVATAYVPNIESAERVYDAAVGRVDEICKALFQSEGSLKTIVPQTPQIDESTLVSPFKKGEFLEAVERIKEYVRAGDVFQAVISRRIDLPQGTTAPFEVYRALRNLNPSPYMFHLQFPEAVVVGASPEMLVRLEDGRVHVRPIAGTRPRGQTALEDDRFANELRRDEKECAEHLMLIDLGRNDVGRVSQPGMVFVTEEMTIEKYSHVMHLVSHVEGDIDPDKTWADVVRAAFPAGTLSGAPKIRAMEVIEELEPHRRGIYGGAVGYVSYDGNVDFAIAIRTLVAKDHQFSVQAGAGIVYDSVPEAEFQETVNKAKGLLAAIAMAKHEC